MRLFSNFLNKAMSSIVSIAMVVTTFPMAVPRAVAAPFCSSGYAADSGQDPQCAGARIGGQTVAYPKLQWERVAEMPLATTNGGAVAPSGGSEAIALANRSASALGLTAADVASVVTMFPANTPYIFARYDPLDGNLQIDMFKLEKTMVAGEKRAGLYRASFTPANGDFWKVSRSYIHPDAFKAGNTPGLNPFESFRNGTSDAFNGISLTGAQVAIGHAMRYAGAPVAVLQVAETRMATETQKSGNAFRKKVTTIVKGHAKPRWYIAQPTAFMQRSTNLQTAAFCANDPHTTTCPMYQMAGSGVAFEEFDGGMLSSAEDMWELDRQTKSGFGFLAILVIAVVASFALAAIAPALGLGAGAAGAAGTTTASAGMFGSLLMSQGLIAAGASLATTIAVETAAYAVGLALISGANMSSVIAMGSGVIFANVDVAKGAMDNLPLDEMNKRLNNKLNPLTTQDFSKGNATLTGFKQSIIGDCAPSSTLAACGGSTGVVPHVDQYEEHNMVNFVRDNNGQIVRDTSK